jgi:hypothetical protein
MKHILPILTLTTLTAAAFADAGAAAPAAPAAAGLSYNRVGFSRSGDSTNVTVSNLLNGGNVLLTITSGNDGEGYNGSTNNASQVALFSVGYVFKNVAAGIDATVSVGGSVNGSQSGYSVNLRRSLSEVVAGLEFALGYGHLKSSGNDAYTTMSYELSYNINKQFSVAYGIIDPNGNNENVHVASVRYNY